MHKPKSKMPSSQVHPSWAEMDKATIRKKDIVSSKNDKVY
jgi:hypothetical protein